MADRYAEKSADMSGAEQILQRSNLNLKQRINLQKFLAAQIRDLTREEKQKKTEKTTGYSLMEKLAGHFDEKENEKNAKQ